MDWTNERFIKLYTRDTANWLCLSFDAQALFVLLARKLDRSGRLELGRHGTRAVAVAIGHGPMWSRLEPALDELLADGCFVLAGTALLAPNFVAAQEARKSNAQCQRDFRERHPQEPNGYAKRRNEPLRNRKQTKDGVRTGKPSEQTRTEQTRTDSGVLAGAEPPTSLPLRAGEPLAVLASASRGRFPNVEGRDIGKGIAIRLIDAVKRYPMRAEWEHLGRWLGAGGMAWRADLGPTWVASAALNEAMALSRAWDGLAPVQAHSAHRGRLEAPPHAAFKELPDDGGLFGHAAKVGS